ncbi:hypothetical protein NMG60_11022095 [Bertholletia excelsa]
MAGNGRFELDSGSPEAGFVGNYLNGPRGNYPGPSLDRSGSFGEGGESRMFGSGASISRVSTAVMGNMPPLSQCLMLDPITLGDPKYMRSGELRRVLGLSIGNVSEENSLGTAHSRPLSSGLMEELKRYKESVQDTNTRARDRAKKLDEHLHKLNKYVEVLSSRKQQRNELSTNERSGGLNLKMGNQMHRNPTDLGGQRLEDRSKNVLLNKRVRSSVTETRVECQSNGVAMHPLVLAKDRDIVKDGNPGSDLVEEKIRRLPAGGEGWDKRMKRKRSLSTAFTRPVDSDKELKRPVHHKVSSESSLQSCDAHGFRSGSINGIRGTNKLDSSSSPASSFGRAMPKHDQEKATLTRDLTAGLNKEKLLAKGNNKLNTREDNHIASPSPLTKGKAARAPRSGSMVAASSSPNITRASGVPESWEQPSTVNKIYSVGGANNRKRSLPSGSSSPPMAQWVGQRPQKISRTRRANLVSPVSNHEELQMSSGGCSPSDFGSRMNAVGINGSLFRGVANGTQQLKVKLENVSSPARFSESEESGAGENRLKEKVTGSGELEEKVSAVQNSGLAVLIPKKNKSLTKEEITDGVRRQGRSGRGSSSMANNSPTMEKLENAPTAKPLRSTRPGSDKNGSKTGRPLKKMMDRKGQSRRGHVPNSSSPDYTGESDDDREELLAAAKYSHSASFDACSSSFWKNMEIIFGSVRFRDTSYFTQQVKSAVELHESLTQMLNSNHNVLDALVHGEISVSGSIRSGERGRCESAKMVENGSEFQDFDILCGKLDTEVRLNQVTPLYQRVLSALILEDEIEEFDDGMGRNVSLQYTTNDYKYNAEPRKRDKMDCEYGMTYGSQTQKQCGENRFFSCNGSSVSNRSPVIQNSPQNEDMFVHSNNGSLASLSVNELDGPEFAGLNGFCGSSFDNQYAEMRMEDKLLLELQSIGIYLDAVPDLDDGEDEAVNQEIVKLKKEVLKQIGKNKACLAKLCKAVEQEKQSEAVELEQVAMDRLVELAYKKLLATRGSIASKWGIPKVSKQVALAFAKRTVARCRAFEDLGKSCFNEPVLRDAIFAAPSQGNEAELLIDGLGVGSSNGSAEQHHDFHRGSLDAFDNYTHQFDQAFAQNGPTLNRGKKKEVLLDDVGNNTASRPSTTIANNLLGGAKAKRSERERDKDVSSRNTVAKGGRPSSSKGERKSKAKPKQKTSQLSTSGNGFVNKFTDTAHPVYPSAAGTGDFINTASDRKREAGLMSPSIFPRNTSKENNEAMDMTNLQLPELDSIDELAVGSDLGGHQDLASWLNFDEDGLGDHESVGLAIPMDDISELNMF